MALQIDFYNIHQELTCRQPYRSCFANLSRTSYHQWLAFAPVVPCLYLLYCTSVEHVHLSRIVWGYLVASNKCATFIYKLS